MKRSTRILGNLSFAILLVISLLGAMPVSTVEAAPLTYIVNSLEDTIVGDCDTAHCTLREAITAAEANNNIPETDTITFSVSGTISLTATLPNINENLVIDGAGQNIKLGGNNAFRVLYIVAGTVTLNHLTIQNGRGDYTYGGGIFNTGGTLTVLNSTFTGNSAANGGGISNLATLTIANSTFHDNSATALGGGVYNEGGTLTILHGTFSGNGATTNGGGGVFNAGNATMNLGNTIIANSTSGGDCGNAGTISSNTNNLIQDDSCDPSFYGDPKLEALADNGGSTQTMALSLDSPARESGDLTICNNTPINNLDQRGVSRPKGPNCDIGAYEAVYASSISIIPNPLNFGQLPIGTTSAPRTVTLTYTGAGVINIGALTINGEFAFSGDNNCDHATLPFGGSCTFSVTFSPTTTGYKNGTVTIPSDAFSSPDSLPLIGIGTDPKVGLSPTYLIYAQQYVDTTSFSKLMTITNTGTGTLVIGNLYTNGDFILHTDRCTGARLVAGAKCTFKVAFMPLSSGIHNGQVIIPSNAATSPNKVTLRSSTKAGTQLLKMGNFDIVTTPIPWMVSTPDQRLVRLRDCSVFRSPLCSAKFTGSKLSPVLSATQLIRRYGAAGDKFYIGLSSRALKVPLGGQYKLIVSFYGNTGLVASKTLLFSSGTHAFQTVGLTYTVPARYTRILFNFTYQKSGGYAWFDDALLILLP